MATTTMRKNDENNNNSSRLAEGTERKRMRCCSRPEYHRSFLLLLLLQLLLWMFVCADQVHCHKVGGSLHRLSTEAVYRVRGGVKNGPPPPYGTEQKQQQKQQQQQQSPIRPSTTPTLGDLDNYPYPSYASSTSQQLQQQQYQQQQQYVQKNDVSVVNDIPSLIRRIRLYLTHLHASSPTLSNGLWACLVVFCGWQVPQWRSLWAAHLVCSRHNLWARPWSALLGAVSHAEPFHLLVNLYAYLSLGPSVEEMLKVLSPTIVTSRGLQTTSSSLSSRLWPFVTGGAICSHVVYLLQSRHGGCMGLSGVTLALLAFLARAQPSRSMSLGMVPIKVRAGVALQCLVVWSLLGTLAAPSSRVAHGSHLGGLLFGIAYYEVLTKRYEWRRLWRKASMGGMVWAQWWQEKKGRMFQKTKR